MQEDGSQLRDLFYSTTLWHPSPAVSAQELFFLSSLHPSYFFVSAYGFYLGISLIPCCGLFGNMLTLFYNNNPNIFTCSLRRFSVVPTPDAENGIPLADIPSITCPSSLITHHECFVIPPMPTIILPTPPSIFLRSSESFKCFDDIWTRSTPSPTAHCYPSHCQNQHHIILPSASSSQVSVPQVVMDNVSRKFSIDD